MRGRIFRCIRLLLILVTVIRLTTAGLITPNSVHASPGPLDFFRDTIDDDRPGYTSNHDIYFVLPASAQQINPNNFIFILFPQYHAATPPISISGSYGNPTYSFTDNSVSITNIALLPGTGLQISGITSTNPSIGADFSVILQVSENASGSVIRNQATITASKTTGAVFVSATVETVLSSINISGYSSAGAFVTLTEGGNVLGTTSASGSGFFSFPISGFDPGNHTFTMSGIDIHNRSTSISVLQLFLLASTLTSASGIILSSTIQINKSAIVPGDTLTISGSGKPISQINIFVESPLRSYTTSTDGNGDWSYTLPSSETNSYVPGQYRAYSIVQDSIGNQSITSPTVTFTVNSPTDATNPSPRCNISHGDLNCDGNTNLTDFSILLFYWHTNQKRADINHDSKVDLVDFSIMMFYFKR